MTAAVAEVTRTRPRAVAQTAFSGASRDNQNIALWRPTLSSADAAIFRDAATLRARARDLYRNHPYARQAVRASAVGVVGRRMRYSCRPDHRFLGIDQDEAIRWGQEFERVFDAYTHGIGYYADAGRRMTLSQMLRLAHNSRFVDGEALATLEWAPDRRWKTCLQMIDVDRLSNPVGKPDSVSIKGGVSLGRLGEPLGYWVRNGHPGDIALLGSASHTWTFVARETPWGRPVGLHSYEPDRAGQTRGVSAFAPVIAAMKMGSEFMETSLQQAILQASYAAVLVSQQNYKDALEIIGTMPPDKAKSVVDLAAENLEAASTYHEEVQLRFNGVRVPQLWPGEDFKLLTPGNNGGNLEHFQKHSTKSYAAGLGVDPISVSQDYSDVNYSSAKMAAATSWRIYEIMREDIVNELAMPLAAAHLEEVVFSGALKLPKGLKPADFYEARDALVAGKFLTQGAPNLDPMKEVSALEKEMQLGLMTLEEACAERGLDHLEVLDQLAREQNEKAERGLGMTFATPPVGPEPIEDTADDPVDPSEATGET